MTNARLSVLKTLFVAGLLLSLCPATARAQMFTPIGSLKIARAGHRATLLPDGRVLATGGFDDSGVAIADAEIFSPSSGTWSPAGRGNAARLEHVAAALRDGRVLVAAGVSSSSSCRADATAEIFDPASGTWTRATDPPVTLGPGATAVVLGDGRVLVSGAASRCGDASKAVMLFDPATNRWLPWERDSGIHAAERPGVEQDIGGLITGRTAYTVTCLAYGSILIAGGVIAGSVTTGADIYVPDVPCNASPAPRAATNPAPVR